MLLHVVQLLHSCFRAPFLTWLGFGLGLIVLGIIVMLVALFVFICKELGNAGVISCCKDSDVSMVSGII